MEWFEHYNWLLSPKLKCRYFANNASTLRKAKYLAWDILRGHLQVTGSVTGNTQPRAFLRMKGVPITKLLSEI